MPAIDVIPSRHVHRLRHRNSAMSATIRLLPEPPDRSTRQNAVTRIEKRNGVVARESWPPGIALTWQALKCPR